MMRVINVIVKRVTDSTGLQVNVSSSAKPQQANIFSREQTETLEQATPTSASTTVPIAHASSVNLNRLYFRLANK
jgi:hypothetical protein